MGKFCEVDSRTPRQFPQWVDPRPSVLAHFPTVELLHLRRCMKEPSEKRKRTLVLHERALRFSTAVNVSCPKQFSDRPSAIVWEQLVRAADSTSNNLIEADDASSDDDFLYKMRLALREAKESRGALAKVRMGQLDHHAKVSEQDLESEAHQLASIYSAIIMNMRLRLDDERRRKATNRKLRT